MALPEILVVDDERHIADSMVVLADSFGFHAVAAADLDEARDQLERYHESIFLTIVDKVWNRSSAAGLDFVIAAQAQYSNMRHVLMTAWPKKRITPIELARIQDAEIELVDKVELDLKRYLPAERLAKRMPMVRAAVDEAGFVPLTAAEIGSASPALVDRIAWAQWTVESLQRKYSGMLESWNAVAQQLVDQLMDPGNPSDASLALGDRVYSRHELVEEVLSGSVIGQELVRLNVSLNTRLANRLRRPTLSRDGE